MNRSDFHIDISVLNAHFNMAKSGSVEVLHMFLTGNVSPENNFRSAGVLVSEGQTERHRPLRNLFFP